MKVVFNNNGGFGKQICSIPMLKQYKEQNECEIGVVTAYRNIYTRSKFIDKIFELNNDGTVDNYFLWKKENELIKVLNLEPYHSEDFLNRKEKIHISNLYKKLAGLKYANSIDKYTYSLTNNEQSQLDGTLFPTFKKFVNSNKFVICQFFGGGVLNIQDDPRSLNINQIKEIIKIILKNNYKIVMMVDYDITNFIGMYLNDLGLNTNNFFILNDVYQYMYIVKKYNPKFFLIDSYLQHFLNLDYFDIEHKAFVYWSKTDKDIFGYPFNLNYEVEPNCKTPVCNYPFGSFATIVSPCRYNNSCREMMNNNKMIEQFENYLKE